MNFVPFLVAVGFELPIIFKNGSKFIVILVFISKTWVLVVMHQIFAIQERYHKYLCLKRAHKDEEKDPCVWKWIYTSMG